MIFPSGNETLFHVPKQYVLFSLGSTHSLFHRIRHLCLFGLLAAILDGCVNRMKTVQCCVFLVPRFAFQKVNSRNWFKRSFAL